MTHLFSCQTCEASSLRQTTAWLAEVNESSSILLSSNKSSKPKWIVYPTRLHTIENKHGRLNQERKKNEDKEATSFYQTVSKLYQSVYEPIRLPAIKSKRRIYFSKMPYFASIFFQLERSKSKLVDLSVPIRLYHILRYTLYTTSIPLRRKINAEVSFCRFRTISNIFFLLKISSSY